VPRIRNTAQKQDIIHLRENGHNPQREVLGQPS
jgi:hypothetical protein